MRIDFYKVDPGGNITAIVKGQYSKEEGIKISKAILEKDHDIEQVGFWAEPELEGSAARLFMMGGEFCGNGVRSLAYLAWKKNNLPEEFLLEASGVDGQIRVFAKDGYSAMEILLSALSSKNEAIVCVPGICHYITNEPINRDKAISMLEEKDLKKEDAAGVISVKEENGSLAIDPIVWVRDTETLYEETACASGALALAYQRYSRGDGDRFNITQPSGSVYEVVFDNQAAVLSGPILRVGEESIDI